MDFTQTKCTNCGSSLKIRPDTSNLHCHYCHTELYIDDDASKLERKIYVMTSAQERIKKAEILEKVELGRIELEKMKFHDERRRKKDKTFIIFLLL